MVYSSSLRLFLITFGLSGGLFLLAHVALSDQTISRWQPTVIVVDFDDVLSARKKLGFFDWFGLTTLIFKNPKIFYLLRPHTFNELYDKGVALKKEMNGASNIIYRILHDLDDQGYGDLTPYLHEILEHTIKPKPIRQMIDYLYELKARGYMLVGATNQDYLQTKIYREKLKQKYGIDLDDLFDLIVTTRVNHLTPIAGLHNGYYPMDNNVIMIADPQSFKPQKSYFVTVERAIEERHPHAYQFIMTDDKEENLEGARNAGMETIHFYLPQGSAAKSTDRELKDATLLWHQAMDRLLAAG